MVDRLGEWGTATFSESNLHICVHNPVEFLKTIREEVAGLSPVLAYLVETAVLTGKSQTYETNKQLFWELSDFMSNIERKIRVGPWDQDVIGVIGPRDEAVEILKLFASGAKHGRYQVAEADFEQHPWAWSGIINGVMTDIDGATLIHVDFIHVNTNRTFKLIEGLTDAQKLIGVFDLNEGLSPQFAWYNYIRPGFPLPIVLTHYDALIAQGKARADAVVQDYEAKIRDFFHEQGLGVSAFYLACPGTNGDFANFNEVVLTLILNIASCPPVSYMPEIPYKLPFEYLERKISASSARPSHEHIDSNRLCWTDQDTRMVTGALKYHIHRKGVKLCQKCGRLVEGGDRCADGTPAKKATMLELMGNFYLHALRKLHAYWEKLCVPEFDEVVDAIISEDMRVIRLEDLQAPEGEIYSRLAERTAARIGKALDKVVYEVSPRNDAETDKIRDGIVALGISDPTFCTSLDPGKSAIGHPLKTRPRKKRSARCRIISPPVSKPMLLPPMKDNPRLGTHAENLEILKNQLFVDLIPPNGNKTRRKPVKSPLAPPKSGLKSAVTNIKHLNAKTYVVIPQVIPAPAGSYAFKVVLQDQTDGCGAVSLKPFAEGAFDTDYKSTIGTSIMKKELCIPGTDAKFRFIIWDLAMPAEFKRVRQTHFQNAEAGIVIFDVTRRETFKTVEKCITEARRGSGKPDLPVILVGTNASDPEREVSHEEAASLGKTLGLHYMESAGVPRDWVNDIFDWLARILVQPRDQAAG